MSGYGLLAIITGLLFIIQLQVIDKIIDHRAQSQRKITESHKVTSPWKAKITSWEYGAYLYILEHGWSPSIRKPCWRNTFVRSEIIAEVY